MWSRGGEPEDDATEDIDVESLLSLALLEGLASVHRGEFEHTMAGPTRQTDSLEP